MKIQLLLIICIVTLNSCTNNVLMGYYYPINQHKDVKYYKYTSPKYPKNKKMRSYVRMEVNEKDRTLLKRYHNGERELYNITEEKMMGNYIELVSYVDYKKAGTDSFISHVKSKASRITKNKIYTINKKEPYSYIVEIKNEDGKFLLEKKRQFVKYEKITVQNKKYKTAKFKDEYIYTGIDQNNNFSFIQHSYFAQGIGLVRYERVLDSGELRVLELTQILNQEEYKKEVAFRR